MSARIVEVELGGATWYLATAEFPSALMAKRVWERIERKVPRGSLGIYRHGPEHDPGRLVSVVTLDRAQLDRCLRFMRTGSEHTLDDVTIQGLIARRARVVLDYAKEGESGRVMWRRPRGAQLTPEGEMREQLGGDE